VNNLVIRMLVRDLKRARAAVARIGGIADDGERL
jgi:hypothetical protein